jgi:hypothetical protein
VIRRALLFAAIATLPCACFPALFAFNLVNPMQQVFLMEFDVENRSGERVLVTPVGSVGDRGHRVHPPLFARLMPALPSPRISQFSLETGETRRFIYDWDDVILAEILVEFPDREFRLLTVDPAPTENLYHPTPQTEIVIGPRATLALAPSSTQELGLGSPYHLWLGFVLSTSVVPFGLLVARSRVRPSEDRRPNERSS